MSNSPCQILRTKGQILPQRFTAQLFTVYLCSLGLHLHQHLKVSVMWNWNDNVFSLQARTWRQPKVEWTQFGHCARLLPDKVFNIFNICAMLLSSLQSSSPSLPIALQGNRHLQHNHYNYIFVMESRNKIVCKEESVKCISSHVCISSHENFKERRWRF